MGREIEVGKIDFFISRTGADKAIALEVNHILQNAGYQTLLQDEDFGSESFMSCMEKGFAAVDSKARLITLLSPQYLQSKHCRAEYLYPLTDDPQNEKRRLIVLRIAQCDPLGFLKPIPYIDMVPLLHDVARFEEAVLIAVGEKKAERPGWFSALQQAPQIIHSDIRPTPNFTGRLDELNTLKDTLWSNGPAAISLAAITQPAAVHGLGGVGKSILAREYAWQNREAYAGLWWLNAEQETGLIDGLIDLGNHFIPGLKEMQDRRLAANATRHFLQTHYAGADKPWLLVFDNIEDEETCRAHMPTGGAHVLLTSRNRNWSEAIRAVPLDLWSEAEAISYLLKESGRKDMTEEQAKSLTEDLGCLPLALSHAAAFLRHNRLISVEAYLSDIRAWLAKAPKGADYPASIFATFKAAMEKCEQEAAGAKAILSFAAILAPDNIPFELYQQEASLYLEPMSNIASDPSAFVEALGVLDRFSLVQVDMKTKCFSLHRLVQATAQNELGENKPVWIVFAVCTFVFAHPGTDFKNWKAFERLLPHGKEIVKQAPDDIGVPLTALLDQIASYLYQRAEYQIAEPLFRRALAIREASFEPDHPDVASSLNNLAMLLQDINYHEEAEQLFRQALAIYEARLKPDDPLIASSLNNLATLLNNTNRHDEAEQLLRQALAIYEARLKPDDPLVASSLNNLAALLRNTNRFEEAEPLYRRALAINEANLEPYHPHVAKNLDNLALLLMDTNRLKEAEPLFRRALAIKEASLQPCHPDIAISLGNLAMLLHDTNRYDEAEPLLRQALEIYKESFGTDHPSVVKILFDLGLLLAITKRFQEAIKLQRQSLKICEKIYPPEHSSIINCRENIKYLLSQK